MIWTQLSFSQQAGSSSASSPASSAARLSEILIKTPQPFDPAQVEEARRKAQEIREAIRNGREFADLAKTYSQGPSAAQGGDVGYFSQGDLAPAMEDTVLKMKVGDVSEIIRTKQGFVILKVTARGDSTRIGRGPASVEKQGEVPPELKSYVDAVTQAVKRKWYELISFLPKTKLGNMGNLDIEFTVQQDGTVANMKLVSASGDRDLDKAAWEAIRQMSPFSPFPDAAKVDHVLLRIHFAYK